MRPISLVLATVATACTPAASPVWETEAGITLLGQRIGTWHASIEADGTRSETSTYAMSVRGRAITTEVRTTLLPDGRIHRWRDGARVDDPPAPPLVWVAAEDEAVVEHLGAVRFVDDGREGAWRVRRWHEDGVVWLDAEDHPVGARYGPIAVHPDAPDGPAPDPFALLGKPTDRLPRARRAHTLVLDIDGAVPAHGRQTVEGRRVTVRAPLEAEIARVPLAPPAPSALTPPGTWPDRKAAAWALVRHVHDALDDRPTPGPPAALAALEAGAGDCNEHATLLVELARATGIPARPVAGLVYVDQPPGFYPHAWAELDLGAPAGWVAVDPALGQPIADATHVTLAVGEVDAWDALRALSDLQLSVVDIR